MRLTREDSYVQNSEIKILGFGVGGRSHIYHRFCGKSRRSGVKETAESIKIEEPTTSTSSVDMSLDKNGTRKVDQLVTLQVGQFTPTSIQTSNGTYNFSYGHGSSFLAECGWAIKLLDVGSNGGAFYFEENLGFSSSAEIRCRLPLRRAEAPRILWICSGLTRA